MAVKKKNVSKDDLIADLIAEKKELEVRLKHLENDFSVTQDEFENTTKSYLEMLSNLEIVVNERTKKVKEISKTIEKQSRELQSMLDAVPAVLYYKDREMKYVRVNKMFCDMFDRTREEIIGKTDEKVFPETPGFTDQADKKILKTGKALLNKSETISTHSSTRTLQVTRIPLRDKKNKIIGILGFALDMTG